MTQSKAAGSIIAAQTADVWTAQAKEGAFTAGRRLSLMVAGPQKGDDPCIGALRQQLG
jgi:hypothetical protein